jgi:hypothetical protein
VTELIQSGSAGGALRAVDAAAIGAIRQHLGLVLPERRPCSSSSTATRPSVRAAAELALELAEEHGAARPSRPPTRPRSALWRARHQAYYATVAVNPGMANVITDLAVPVSRLAEVIDASLAAVERTGAARLPHRPRRRRQLPPQPVLPARRRRARARVEAAYGEMVRWRSPPAAPAPASTASACASSLRARRARRRRRPDVGHQGRARPGGDHEPGQEAACSTRAN